MMERIAVLTLLYFLVSCKDSDNPIETIASFSAMDTVKVDQKVSFSNTSKNAESYTWNFGDGNISNVENPTHVFVEEGTFTVTLFANGSNVSSSTKTLNVVPVPKASYQVNDHLILDQEFSINNTSVNSTSFLWDFGDGNFSTNENPVHTYNQIGDYKITLDAIGENGNSLSTTEVIVCEGKTLTLEAPAGGLILNSQEDVIWFNQQCYNRIVGDFILGFAHLGFSSTNDLTPLNNLLSIDGNLYIEDNYELISLKGLEKLASISKAVIISNNVKLTDFCDFELIVSGFTDDLIISNNGYNPSKEDLGNGNCSQ